MIALQYMRMACNSTYLLDQETDHGVKADELIALLTEIFEDHRAKVVVFSQWVRTHELLVKRLADRSWGHVMVHGGVPGPKRNELVKRFKDDAQCRLFLSTDAGGVGLNLQSANVVVNMDQPWNPAVLEQRVGRVHRLGQHQPVRVIHFIAQDTIEHGMLGLLDFKKSVFAGVLDSGRDEVFLGGTKLKRFMESVERATDEIPSSMPSLQKPPVEETEPDEESAVVAADRGPAAPATGKSDDAWAEMANAGVALLEKVSAALHPPGDGKRSPATQSGSLIDNFVDRDEQSGQRYLKPPMPGEETVRKIVDLRGAFAGKR